MKYLNLLESMVNIDSGTGDTKGITKVSELIRPRLQDLGFSYEPVTAEDGSIHFLARRGTGKKVLLLAHLDTVFPTGTAVARKFNIKGDLALGPGVSDCKSGVTTIVGALEELSHRGWPDLEINCLFNSDEEISSPGSRGIIEKVAKDASAVLVVEPAEMENITVARKGIGRFTLRVFGKAAHAGSNYTDGCNAILELAHQIIKIQGLSRVDQGITLNVGTITGGVRPNIVPDYAMAEVDLRIVKPEQEDLILQELKEITGICKTPGTKTRLEGKITRPPMPSNALNLKLYEMIKAVGKKMGIELGAIESGGGSDANFTAALGIPTVDGLGPIGGGHHSEEEYMNISSLERRINLLAGFLKAFPEY
ncbi:MAG: M20 family metallopeptidase [Firmicutes bacterium]|nr:M20 family metallopeptidase [Bacillota bacterium]